MAKPIDLDQLMEYPLRRGSEHCDEKNADPRFLNGVESILEWAQTLPTLTPQNEPRMINADKLAKRIAGHSNYHGDSILAAIYCAAEGQENDAPIRPIETTPNEWVSVEDRLPASGQNVIATNGSDVGEAWYASLSRSWYRYNGLEWNRICREVTHWMPLPEPPDSRPPEGET